MKQNIEIYLADTTPCTRVVLVHGISVTEIFKFWRNLAIPIGMAEYCVKSGRIPPKSEWLAAMYIAPRQETTTQRCSKPSHGQGRTSERCKIWKGGPPEGTAATRGDHSMKMEPQPKKPFAAS